MIVICRQFRCNLQWESWDDFRKSRLIWSIIASSVSEFDFELTKIHGCVCLESCASLKAYPSTWWNHVKKLIDHLLRPGRRQMSTGKNSFKNVAVISNAHVGRHAEVVKNKSNWCNVFMKWHSYDGFIIDYKYLLWVIVQSS